MSRGNCDASDGTDTLVAVNLCNPLDADKLSTLLPATAARLRRRLEALTARSGASTPILVGGPCKQGKLLLLIKLPAGSSLPQGAAVDDMLHVPLSSGDESASDAPAAEDVAGAERPVVVFVEDGAAAELVRTFGACGREVYVLGCAIWSTRQLLSEMSRRRWGLARGCEHDIPFDAPVVADRAWLWRAAWRERAPAFEPPRRNALASLFAFAVATATFRRRRSVE